MLKATSAKRPLLTPLSYWCVAFLLLGACIFQAKAAELININTADSSTLQTLNGIGPTYAQRIIDYRTQNGPFATTDDIKKVSGIGDTTYAKIKEYITVGASAPVDTTTATSTSATMTESTGGTSTTTQEVPVIYSAHYSFVPMQNDTSAVFTVSAGRDRLGATRMPLAFKAVANTSDLNASYAWSFGDGTTGEGREVSHAYLIAGDYNVVLNAKLFDNEAVSRTKVRIIEPQLSVVDATPAYVSVKNSASYEVNLYGWRLQNGTAVFTFPKDTIIASGQTIKFPVGVTKLPPGKPALALASDPLPQRAQGIPTLTPTQLGSRTNTTAVQEIADKIAVLTRELATLQASETSTAVAAKPQPKRAETAAVVQSLPQSALATSSPARSSWLTTLRHFFFR